MHNHQHYQKLREGFEVWKQWRLENPELDLTNSIISAKHIYPQQLTNVFDNLDFSGLNLSNLQFIDVNLRHANFQEAILRQTLFGNGVVLDGCDFTDCTFDNTTFDLCELVKCKFNNKCNIITGLKFRESVCQLIEVSGRLERVSFNLSTLDHITFSEITFNQCCFINTTIDHCDFADSEFIGGSCNYSPPASLRQLASHTS